MTGPSLLCALLVAGLAAASLLRRTGLQRIGHLSRLAHLTLHTDAVVSLLVHNGSCSEQLCSQREHALLNLVEVASAPQEAAHLSRFVAIDCEDHRKNDRGRNMPFPECSPESGQPLPAVLHFVSPSLKADPATNRPYGILRSPASIKFPHTGEYTTESLTKRLIEIQPSYSFLVHDEASFESFKAVGENASNLTRLIYFSDSDRRSLAFKLVTQRYRNKAIFAEVSRGFDFKKLFDLPQEDLQLPFVLVEKSAQGSPKAIEVHRPAGSLEELQECAQKAFEGSQASLLVVYGADNVHENFEELKALEEVARLNRMFEITNASQFESFLGNADYPMAVFFYTEPQHFNATVTLRLGALSDSFLVAYVHSSTFVEFVSPQVADVGFIREITTNPNFTDGALAMLPPGSPRHKLENMVVFDDFSNVTHVMIQSSIRWAGDRVKPVDPNTVEKEMMDSVQRDRIFAVFLIDPRVGMPFEYMMVAVNPRFADLFDFRYYLGSDDRVFQMLNVRKTDVPKFVLIHYGRDSYKSKEFFNMHPIDDPSKTGFRDFSLNLGIVNSVRPPDPVAQPLQRVPGQREQRAGRHRGGLAGSHRPLALLGRRSAGPAHRRTLG